MMKNIVKSTPVALSGKKLTNHSARKTLVKKLRTANVERQSIIIIMIIMITMITIMIIIIIIITLLTCQVK